MKKKIIIFGFWLFIWQLVTLLVNQPIFLASPIETIRALTVQLGEVSFYQTVGYSFLRITLGFLLAFVAGVLLACVSSRFRLVGEVLEPMMLLLKSIPMVSFVVLLLIWWGARGLSIAVSFLIVFPQIYVSTLAGIRAVPVSLLEMAKVYHMPLWNQICYLYRPAVAPFIDSCLRVALGMSWKSGVAAEVIGLPDYSIGERLYMSKIYLDTADLFAWTAVIVILSYGFERLGLYGWKRFCEWRPGFSKDIKDMVTENQATIYYENAGMKYGAHLLFRDLNKSLLSGRIYGLMAPSGWGKTTLLRVTAGIQRLSEGTVKSPSMSVVFQEERFVEELDPISNIALVYGNIEKIKEELSSLLPGEALVLPMKELSGGMRRRVAIVRAMLYPAKVIWLDEPFNGLDAKTKEKTIEYILQHRENRTLVVTSHYEDEIRALGGELWIPTLAKKA